MVQQQIERAPPPPTPPGWVGRGGFCACTAFTLIEGRGSEFRQGFADQIDNLIDHFPGIVYHQFHLFGIGCGTLTMIIRFLGGYPEGVCYAILIMNSTVPLLDRYFRGKAFGE